MAPWDPFYSAKKQEPDSPFDVVTKRIAELPAPTLALSAFSLGVLTAWGTSVAYKRYLRRIPNVDWITPDMYKKKRWIKGRVVSVGDADNFRIYHTPGLGWRWPLKLRTVPSTPKTLKDNTIHIRMAGVDAPEGAHFGKPMQEHFQASLEWLERQVAGRTVYCQLLRRDQYSRVVAMPYLKPRFLPGFLVKGKCVPMEMVRAGWAVTHEQAGAEYGPYGKEAFFALQKVAELARRGIWTDGPLKETPAEYKKRYASDAAAAESNEDAVPKFTSNDVATKRRPAKKSGLWERITKFLGR